MQWLFLNETDEESEVIQEVTTAWLCNNNTKCNWPPEKYVQIYLAKMITPEPNWRQHPVEVEDFFGKYIIFVLTLYK